MKYAVLGAILFLFSASSYAEPTMVARDAAGNMVTLQQEKCVASPWMEKWKTAVFVDEGKTFAACWRIQDGGVMIVDSAGDVTNLPPEIFRPATGV